MSHVGRLSAYAKVPANNQSVRKDPFLKKDTNAAAAKVSNNLSTPSHVPLSLDFTRNDQVSARTPNSFVSNLNVGSQAKAKINTFRDSPSSRGISISGETSSARGSAMKMDMTSARGTPMKNDSLAHKSSTPMRNENQAASKIQNIYRKRFKGEIKERTLAVNIPDTPLSERSWLNTPNTPSRVAHNYISPPSASMDMEGYRRDVVTPKYYPSMVTPNSSEFSMDMDLSSSDVKFHGLQSHVESRMIIDVEDNCVQQSITLESVEHFKALIKQTPSVRARKHFLVVQDKMAHQNCLIETTQMLDDALRMDEMDDFNKVWCKLHICIVRLELLTCTFFLLTSEFGVSIYASTVQYIWTCTTQNVAQERCFRFQ